MPKSKEKGFYSFEIHLAANIIIKHDGTTLGIYLHSNLLLVFLCSFKLQLYFVSDILFV